MSSETAAARRSAVATARGLRSHGNLTALTVSAMHARIAAPFGCRDRARPQTSRGRPHSAASAVPNWRGDLPIACRLGYPRSRPHVPPNPLDGLEADDMRVRAEIEDLRC